MLAVVLLAVALAVDAAAVSASLGAGQATLRPVVIGSVLFGVFQAGMSALGAGAGAWLIAVASGYDHWIAFALLTAVGARMLVATTSEDAEAVSVLALLALSVATSIDALAAGVTLPLLGPPLWIIVGVIGLVTLVLSLGAGVLGRQFGSRLGPAVERVGGVVLIAIGLHILLRHTGWLS